MFRKTNLAVSLLAMLLVSASSQTQSTMKKLLTLAFALVTLALVGTEVMTQTRTINLNTGYDQWSNAKINVGQQDNEWRVIFDTTNQPPPRPPATGRPADVVSDNTWANMNPSLAGNFPNSRWISVKPNQGQPLPAPPNQFRYAFYFTLPPEFSNPVLTLKLSSDDHITKVTLNSTTLFQGSGGIFVNAPLVLPTSPLTSANFNSGPIVNVMTVDVEDTGGAITGLIVDGTVTYKDCYRLPIRDIPGLTDITFWESTFAAPTQHTFAKGDPKLISRLSGPLNTGNSDFESLPGIESYDVFYSDWDGTPNPAGLFVTIEADVPSIGAPSGGGLNIARVDFNGTGKSANSVASFVALGNNAMPDDVGKAVDLDPNVLTDTTMGNTIGTAQRLRVTVGFPCGCVMPPSGLVNWWPFDETSGTTAQDVRGIVNNAGTYFNAPMPVAGVVGHALSFNGVNNWVEVANDPELFPSQCPLDVAGGLTIDVWLKTDIKPGTGRSSGLLTILDKRVNTTIPNGYHLFLFNGRFGFQWNGINYVAPAAGPDYIDVANNQWHFVAVSLTSCRAIGGGFLYVDGKAVLGLPQGGAFTNTAKLYIGRRDPVFGANFFKGSLDELEMFKDALSDENLRTLFEAGSGGKCFRQPCPITINPAALVHQTWGANVAYPPLNLTATGGTGPYTFTVSNGTLPPGMVLDPDGTLHGTPVTPGTYTFAVTVTDAKGCMGARSYQLVIGDVPVDTTCIRVQVFEPHFPNPPHGPPAANSHVIATGVSYSGSSQAFTDSNGFACLIVKRNSQVSLQAFDNQVSNHVSVPIVVTIPNIASGAADCGNEARCPLVQQIDLDIIVGAENFYAIKARRDAEFEALRKELGDRFDDEGTGYGRYKDWVGYWEPKVYPHGDFGIAFNAMNQIKQVAPATLSGSCGGWKELGPTDTPLGGSFQRGVGQVDWIDFDPNNADNLFTGSPVGGLFYSTNAGATWQSGGTDFLLPNIGAAHVAVDPNDSSTWFLATGTYEGNSHGVYRTNNKGITWTPIGLDYHQDWSKNPTPWIYDVKKLVIAPSPPNPLGTILAATNFGLFMTNNANDPIPSNVTWSYVPTGVNNIPSYHADDGPFYDIEYMPGNPQTIYASGVTLVRSLNGGVTWNPLPNIPFLPDPSVVRIAMEVTPANPDYLYVVVVAPGPAACTGGSVPTSRLYRFDANSGAWTDKGPICNTGSYDTGQRGVHSSRAQSIGVSPIDPNLIFIGDVKMAKCTTGGDPSFCSWSTEGAGVVHDDIHQMKFAPNDPLGFTIYDASDGGVFKSVNGGVNWTRQSKGLAVALVERMSTSATDPSLILAGLFDEGTVLYKGGTWQHVLGGDGLTPIIDHTDPNYMFASSQSGPMSRSDDMGLNWNHLVSLPCPNNWFTFAILNSVDTHTVFGACKPEVVRSITRGGNWLPISNFTSAGKTNYEVWKLYTAPSDPNYLYAHLVDGNPQFLYRTTGANDPIPQWTSIPHPENQWISDIDVDEADPNKFWLTYAGGPNKVEYYDGNSFIQPNLTTNLDPGLSVNSIVHKRGSNQLFIGTNLGVYSGSGTVPNWTRVGTATAGEMPYVEVGDLEINYVNNKLRAATRGRGVWEIKLEPCACVAPPSGLVDWWPFDETSGTSAQDIRGLTNNVGTLMNGPTPVTGIVGGALSFDGVDDFVEVANGPEVNFFGSCPLASDPPPDAEPLTIDVWVKTNLPANQLGPNSGLMTILDKRVNPGNPRGYHLFLFKGRLGFQINGTNFVAPANGPQYVDVADNQWHLVAVSLQRCSGAGGQLYVDGKPVASTPGTDGLANTANLFIGQRDPVFGANFFTGTLDELEIFKRALSDDEVRTLFEASGGGKCFRQPCPTITINPATLVNQTWQVGVDYPPFQLTATGGTGPYTFTARSVGSLIVPTPTVVPPGMFVSADGTLQGHPAIPGTYTFTVTVADTNGCLSTREYQLTICPEITLNPAPGALPAPVVNRPYFAQTFTATGGCNSSFTYSLTNGALPNGLTLDTDGVLAGSPSQPGVFTFTVTATDSCGCSQSQTYTLMANVRRGGFTFTPGMNEFCVWGGGGPFSSPTLVNNLNSPFLSGNTGGVRYGAIGLCYGRILSANDKVAFKYTFNATPVGVISYPDVDPNNFVNTRRNVFGAGLSPIGFQLYFRPQSRVKPFVNTSGGFIFFKDPVPRLNGAQFNFTFDFGGGVQVFRDSRRAFTFGYKYQHLSNGGRALNNPGFDGHVFYFGYSIFKAKKIGDGPKN